MRIASGESAGPHCVGEGLRAMPVARQKRRSCTIANRRAAKPAVMVLRCLEKISPRFDASTRYQMGDPGHRQTIEGVRVRKAKAGDGLGGAWHFWADSWLFKRIKKCWEKCFEKLYHLDCVKHHPWRNKMSAPSRLAFRRFLMRSAITGKTPEIRLCCRVLLSDPGSLNDAYDDVVDDYEGNIYGGPATDFMDWLLANADAILALIVKIIDLFSGPSAEAAK